MKPEAYNRQAKWTGGMIVLLVLAFAAMVWSIWSYTGQPVVYYSLATNKPVAIETSEGKRVVTPYTTIPEKHEKVWVK